MLFSNACSAVLTVFCIGALGFLLKRKGWITGETAKVMPKFLTNIVLPPFLLRTVVSTFEHDQLLRMVSGCVVPFLSTFLSICVAAVLARVFRIRKGRRGTFMVAIATSNTMNIGLPMALALFGEKAVPYVLLYFFGSVTSFWTYGNYILSRDGEGASVKLFSKDSLRKIFSPPLTGFLIGLGMVLLDLHLPVFLDKTFKYVGDMTVAMAIMYIGVLMEDVRLRDMHLFDRDVLLVLFGRVVVAPLIIVGLSRLYPMPDMMFQVFLVQSSLPVMVNLAVLSGVYRTDVKYTAVLVTTTTLLSMVMVPIWAILSVYAR